MLVLRPNQMLASTFFSRAAKRFLSSSGVKFAELQSNERLSARQADWLLAQQRYAKHSLLLYSSHLENQVEYMTPRRLRAVHHQQTVEERRQLRGFKNQPIFAEERPANIDTKCKANSFPKNWMEDYEFYKGNVSNDEVSQYGTTDPNLPPSTVPCSGCGAHFHCIRTTLPGYIPREIFYGRSNRELQTVICQRCHFLKHYNIALDLEISADTYVETISRIKDDFALAIVIVDLLDFPCSIWPGIQKLLGPKRPVFVVGNKVDLLPRDHNGYIEHVKRCLKDQMLQSGFDLLNIKNISLISAKTGYGIEELITQLHNIWRYKGNVYLLGCTNVGKSTLFNILLQSDYCRPEATTLIRKATTCPWPGTTLQMLKFPIYRPSEIRIYQRFRRLFSERAQKQAKEKLRRDQARKTGNVDAARLVGDVGRTFVENVDVPDAFAMSEGTEPITVLNEKSPDYRLSKWCYDTPGVINPQQITNLLNEDELQWLTPEDMIVPRAVRIKLGMTVFLAGLGRLDFIECQHVEVDWIKVVIFSALQLPIVVSETKNAEEIYKSYLGTEVLGVPFGSDERLSQWPGIQSKGEPIKIVGNTDEGLSADIVMSSAGWIGLSLPYASECVFKAWTPHARGIYTRTPSLMPYSERLMGKRIRHSLAYNMRKPFVFKK